MEPVIETRVYSSRYRATHLIARGGMALVYRAQDQLLNRAVALKILYPELSADPSFVERFRREAQAAANLSHPNIVPVFDWGEDNGTYFIVMELVDGQSLADVLRGGVVLTASRTAQLSAQVASALAYAHRQGVVHRDVKPGNILITPDAQVKVTDFGIAQAVASEDHLAEEGSVMGTATYFSPEQASGAMVDGRSDIYSLGIVMYEMLTGRPPFVGDTPLAVSSQHVNGVVAPLNDVNPEVPRDLAAIVMKCLSKNPASRYPTADEVRSDLVRFVDGQPVRASAGPGAFQGVDATQAVGVVSMGERTQAVPVFQGPRTDVKARSGGGKKRRTPWVVLLVVIAVIAAGVGYVVATKKSTVTLPNVVNESASSAIAALRADGLTALETLVTSNAKTGTVIAMDPKAGSTIAANGTVTLQVAIGSTVAPAIVPDVTGLSVAAAENDLNNAGLGYVLNPITVTTTTTSTTVKGGKGTPSSTTTSTTMAGGTTTSMAGGTTPQPNTVLSQSPIGGTSVKKGSTVTLDVLAQNSTYPVPTLTGDTATQAASVLGQEGLTVAPTTSSVCSNTVNAGLVVKTLPAAGSNVSANTQVTLITSSGVCQVVVASVVNLPQTQAAQILSKEGLTPEINTAAPGSCTSTQLGQIATQSVAPGTFAPYGSVVTLGVCQSSSTGTTTSTTTTTLPTSG